MNLQGEIILIDDDSDDREFFEIAYNDLNCTNKLKKFANSQDAIDYLRDPKVRPFMIVSDINMNTTNGLELREFIFHDEQLHEKCIPYILMTGGQNPMLAKEAYKKSVQGFFAKRNSMDDYKKLLSYIINYWQHAIPD